MLSGPTWSNFEKVLKRLFHQTAPMNLSYFSFVLLNPLDKMSTVYYSAKMFQFFESPFRKSNTTLLNLFLLSESINYNFIVYLSNVPLVFKIFVA